MQCGNLDSRIKSADFQELTGTLKEVELICSGTYGAIIASADGIVPVSIRGQPEYTTLLGNILHISVRYNKPVIVRGVQEENCFTVYELESGGIKFKNYKEANNSQKISA